MTAIPVLTLIEQRVLFSLVEKQLATPDNYPLTLNALVAACNQSSNREPVMSLGEGPVSAAVTVLRRAGLVRSIQGIGSRVPKYEHLLSEVADLSRPELAVLCVLALRGPQTLAEIRTRIARMVEEEQLEGVGDVLDALSLREAPLVALLPRRSGQKEQRHTALLVAEPRESAADAAGAPETSQDRLTALEGLVDSLRGEVAELRSELTQFRKQFE